MLDLHQFIEFITQNQFIRDFTFKIIRDFDRKYELYRERIAKEESQLVRIKDDIINKYPQLDDSKRTLPRGQVNPYHDPGSSFIHFADIVNRPERTKFFPEGSITMNDYSKVQELISILEIKKNTYEGFEHERQMNEQIKKDLQDVERAHIYTHRDWINTCRVSAGHELKYLIDIVQRINPLPKDDRDSLEAIIDAVHERYSCSWVRDLTYGVISNYAADHPNHLNEEQQESRIRLLKENLRRVYEAVRQEIGTTQLYLQLLNRYKTRSEWYNHSYLRGLITQANGELLRACEDILTKDLALFLFDQGVTVQYRIRFGKHEFDLFQMDSPDPIFVEAKVYKDRRAKRKLIDGIAQLHSYLCNIEGHKPIREAYYVIYGLGGPIYELPHKIATNRFIIYPVLIDLGLSKESGSKQASPVIVTQEEVLSKIVEDQYVVTSH